MYSYKKFTFGISRLGTIQSVGSSRAGNSWPVVRPRYMHQGSHLVPAAHLGACVFTVLLASALGEFAFDDNCPYPLFGALLA